MPDATRHAAQSRPTIQGTWVKLEIDISKEVKESVG